MIVELLTLGNELLDGRRIDTNAAWIGKFLAGYGVQVRHRQTVLDKKEDIICAFQLAIKRSDLVISTGGLGPTQDDITFEGVAESFNLPLEYHPDIFSKIEKKFEARGIRCVESNRRQAMLPKGAIPIEAVGTAPGIFLKIGHRMIFCFPGVPSEMESMVQGFFLKELQSKLEIRNVFQKSYSLSGIPEAIVEERIQNAGLDHMENANLHVAYTASVSSVDITFTLTPTDAKQKDQMMDQIDQTFMQVFKGHLIRWNDQTIEEHIVRLLLQKKWKLGVAESVTGGLIASSLVNVPGCSEVLDRGVVSYSYPSKKDLLGVSEGILDKHGAVSVECVLEMARGMRKKSGVDIALSICGIAGPGGATDTKPLGLTYICFIGPTLEMEKLESSGYKNYVESTDFEKKVGPTGQSPVMFKNKQIMEEKIFNDEQGLAKVQGFIFSGDRKRNRMLAANQALMGLHNFLSSNYK